MKSLFYYIKHIFVLGILLAFTSTEILLAEQGRGLEIGAQGSAIETQDPAIETQGQAFFPGLTRVLQSTAIVIILIVGTVFFLKKKFGITKATGKKHMHVVESVPIGTKKFLLLVKIPGKLLVIGVANDRINPLAEITDKAVIDSISSSSGNNDFMGFMKKIYTERCQVRAGVRENNH